MQKSNFSRVSNSTPEECGKCPKSDENAQAVYGCIDPATYRARNLEKWLYTIDKLSQIRGNLGNLLKIQSYNQSSQGYQGS
jgi:hypothetical protein